MEKWRKEETNEVWDRKQTREVTERGQEVKSRGKNKERRGWMKGINRIKRGIRAERGMMKEQSCTRRAGTRREA